MYLTKPKLCHLFNLLIISIFIFHAAASANLKEMLTRHDDLLHDSALITGLVSVYNGLQFFDHATWAENATHISKTYAAGAAAYYSRDLFQGVVQQTLMALKSLRSPEAREDISSIKDALEKPKQQLAGTPSLVEWDNFRNSYIGAFENVKAILQAMKALLCYMSNEHLQKIQSYVRAEQDSGSLVEELQKQSETLDLKEAEIAQETLRLNGLQSQITTAEKRLQKCKERQAALDAEKTRRQELLREIYTQSYEEVAGLYLSKTAVAPIELAIHFNGRDRLPTSVQNYFDLSMNEFFRLNFWDYTPPGQSFLPTLGQLIRECSTRPGFSQNSIPEVTVTILAVKSKRIGKGKKVGLRVNMQLRNSQIPIAQRNFEVAVSATGLVKESSSKKNYEWHTAMTQFLLQQAVAWYPAAQEKLEANTLAHEHADYEASGACRAFIGEQVLDEWQKTPNSPYSVD